jgi:septum formation protein
MITYKIILASNSPRRKELLAGIDVPFEVRVIDGIDESYPDTLSTKDIAEYISKKKAAAYRETMALDELVITADTIVVLGSQVMGKPHDANEACYMLRQLSGQTHQVITGVTLTTKDRQMSFSVETDVTFKTLSDEEIDYYVTHYRPFDKAGAYGIQEWIGHIGVTGMSGSYFNVMGLPVQRIYEALKMFAI